MSNSILGNSPSTQPIGANAQMMQQFNQFKQSFTGNPQQIVMDMVRSGKVSQAQLQSAMQMAKQLGFM